jgi:phosphoglycolate phosphatase
VRSRVKNQIVIELTKAPYLAASSFSRLNDIMDDAKDRVAAFRAVLFDFDGTLIDSYPAITASVNHVRAGHGLPPLNEPEVRRHVGRGLAYLLEQTVPGADQPRDQDRYREHHPGVMLTGTRLLPHAMEALRVIHNSGRRVGVCSNKPRAFTKELLEYLQIGPFVDAAFGPEDVARPKPAPDMLRHALSWLHVAAAEALYIGDMVVDIETALAAGVSVWVVPTGSDERRTLETAGPERILDSLKDLVTLFARETKWHSA